MNNPFNIEDVSHKWINTSELNKEMNVDHPWNFSHNKITQSMNWIEKEDEKKVKRLSSK